MMTLQMDKTTVCSPSERAQSLFDKTMELEAKLRKAVQGKVPPNPTMWQKIRENYETIVLEDHAFSEKNTIELALWQLHYKRIEEFRLTISEVSSSGSSSSNEKGVSVPEQIANIKLQLRTFLSEATGFYHEMVSKIRAKYGLPLGYFPEEQVSDKNGNKLAEVKRGLVSCHRCFIYLGDLARYKGMYGEGDSRNREFSAASSYYLQAASLWPASGNPHHQLAIVATYSGDELAAIYRYFRSLAVENPFPTARENLIHAFDKNYQGYVQLTTASKVSTPSKDLSKRPNGRGRGSGKGKDTSLKDANLVTTPEKDKVITGVDMLKAFCVRFVRLNGILFTKISLETFLDVLSSTSKGLQELISSGSVEGLGLGLDASDSALFIVRLVTILIFSVHNSKKETKGQSYAEVLQRVETARNSLTASFELLGYIIQHCAQLHDPSSSYFLPGVLVFVEWLACCPGIAMGSDPDDRQTAVRNSFWNHCVAFFNQILSLGPTVIDDVEDDTCFSNMSLYDEREIENRLALWEDYELRGFLPLLPAHTILNFSRKHSYGSEGPSEKKARVKRILAAGKALTSVIKVDNDNVYFDSKKKMFLVGVKPSDDLLESHSILPDADNALQDNQTMLNLNTQIYLGDEEDDEEEIVFKPLVAEKSSYAPSGGIRKPDQIATMGDFKASSVSDVAVAFHENLLLQARGNASIQVPTSVGSNLLGLLQASTQSQALHLQYAQSQTVNPQSTQSLATARLQPMQSQVAQHQPLNFQQAQAHVLPAQSQSASLGGSKWLPGDVASIASSLSGYGQIGNGHVMRNAMQGNQFSYYPAHSLPVQQSFNVNGIGGIPYSQSRTPEAVLPPKIDVVSSSGVMANGLGGVQAVARKNPISRPVKHLGPPPGFSTLPSKPLKEAASSLDFSGNNLLVDDYSWLDGYKAESSRATAGLSSNGQMGVSNGHMGASNGHMGVTNGHMAASNGLNGAANFPFPGKQVVQTTQVQPDYSYFQNIMKENHQSEQVPEQYQGQGQSTWPSRRFV